MLNTIEMASWNNLRVLNPTNPPKYVISRKKEVQDRYNSHVKYLKSINKSTGDYIMETFVKDKDYHLCLNTFPYNCEDGIEHWLLWINPNTNIKLAHVEQILNKNFKKFVFFRNIIELQSVKSIVHYHVFVKEHNNNIHKL